MKTVTVNFKRIRRHLTLVKLSTSKHRRQCIIILGDI